MNGLPPVITGSSAPEDKVGLSRPCPPTVVAGIAVADGEPGRFAKTEMRVTVIVPKTPINAARIEGSILGLGDCDILMPVY